MTATSSSAAQQQSTSSLSPPSVFVARAVRAEAAGPRIDGRLDDPDWTVAPVVGGFVQQDPDEGMPATEGTAVRVVYTDDALYVGVRAFDSSADQIAARLTRRDDDSPSDWIGIVIDSYLDRRTAFEFAVNPAAVKRDIYRFDDNEEDDSWDAVWEVGTSRDPQGWSAEFRIPFSQLRFAAADEQIFGFNVYRKINRLNELQQWKLIPKNVSGVVSQLGTLEGIEGISPPRRLEILPYTVRYLVAAADRSGQPLSRWHRPRRRPRGRYQVRRDVQACPHCGSVNVQTGAKHPSQPYRCREKGCRKFFSVKTGTAMAGSNLGYQVWAIASYLLATGLKGQASMKLHRDLGISQKAAWFLAHRLRETWETQQALFAGPVEVDETYMGGKEKNKHAGKKANLGRGPVGKTAVVGAKDRETNQVAARVVEATDSPTLHGFVRGQVADGARVYTDEARAYDGLANRETVKHSVSEYVNGQAHTNGVESFWSMLKRGYHGTYHKMSPKHLQRYVNEFSGRHNIRPMDTAEQMRAIIQGLEGKRLRYRELVV